MISTRLFKAFQQRGLTQAMSATQTGFYKAPVRFFAKEQKDNEEPAAAEQEVEAAEPAKEEAKPAPKAKAAPKAAAAAMEEPLDRALFQPFSVGNIVKIESTEGNKAPHEEDTIEGRYSGVLFTTAS